MNRDEFKALIRELDREYESAVERNQVVEEYIFKPSNITNTININGPLALIELVNNRSKSVLAKLNFNAEMGNGPFGVHAVEIQSEIGNLKVKLENLEVGNFNPLEIEPLQLFENILSVIDTDMDKNAAK